MVKDKWGDFVIEANIPIPERRLRRDKYPWHILDVGDSFLVRPEEGQTLDQLMNGLTSCRNLAQRRTGHKKKFIMARSIQGIRIWRQE